MRFQHPSKLLAVQLVHLRLLFAAFCRFDKLLSCSRKKGWLVDAVGIENNNDWNFRDLAEMRKNSKSLKKNTGELEGILIGPLKAPRSLSATEIPSLWVFRPLP